MPSAYEAAALPGELERPARPRRDSNPRSPHRQCGALATRPRGQVCVERAAGGHRTHCSGLADRHVRRVHYGRGQLRGHPTWPRSRTPSRTRTGALRLRKPLLSPLSYRGVVEGGVEPPVSRGRPGYSRAGLHSPLHRQICSTVKFSKISNTHRREGSNLRTDGFGDHPAATARR